MMSKTKKTHVLSPEEINAELAKLFESDVKEFSENGAKAFGHIFAKHGIDDPQKWLEEKMRTLDKRFTKYPYVINPDLRKETNATCCESGTIEFRSLSIAKRKFTRAHEMAHKITREIEENKSNQLLAKRSGLCIDNNNGHLLSEGLMNLIAEKLSGISYLRSHKSYPKETFTAWATTKFANVDHVYESVFFNPEILGIKVISVLEKLLRFSLMAKLDEFAFGMKRILQGKSYRLPNKAPVLDIPKINDTIQVDVVECESVKQALKNVIEKPNSEIDENNVLIERQNKYYEI